MTMFALKILDFSRSLNPISLKQMKLCLLSKDQLPPDMHEIAIVNGYRHPKSSILECAVSVFSATNETINFWTHFLPVWYFVWKFIVQSSVSFTALGDSYNWPLMSYTLTACIYLLISSLAHAFHCTSSLARHIWFFIDYSTLSMYSVGSSILYRAYVFPSQLENTYFSDYFLPVAFSNSILCTLSACTSRFTTSLTLRKFLRISSFALPYFWTATPLIYRSLFCNPEDDVLCCADSRYHFNNQFILCMIAAFMYASHLPERLAPGKFDIIGHSHQFLHIFGVLATNEQMNGALNNFKLHKNQSLSTYWSVYSLFFLVITNTAIIIIFGWLVSLKEKKKTN